MSESYRVSLSRSAAKYLGQCDVSTCYRLRRKLEALKVDPFDPRHSKRVKGRNDQRSARVGGLRILFQVQGTDIVVAAIGPRGEIYRHGQ